MDCSIQLGAWWRVCLAGSFVLETCCDYCKLNTVLTADNLAFAVACLQHVLLLCAQTVAVLTNGRLFFFAHIHNKAMAHCRLRPQRSAAPCTMAPAVVSRHDATDMSQQRRLACTRRRSDVTRCSSTIDMPPCGPLIYVQI